MHKFLILFFYLPLFGLSAQDTSEGHYLFPINPGDQNYLAGTMGEMRSSHFHAGIDIKTGGKTGLPVYATADGYISRIQVSTGGYGNALYMNHPNGTISVYAHLERFQEEIDQFTTAKQYEQESFEIREFPENGQFFFRQGAIIGYSGNTGSSSGPHLHFEIRDQDHKILDPLRFGFSEIKDNIQPVLKNIAFVTLDSEARVNETYGRFEFDVIKSRGIYHTRAPIQLRGKIGIEIYGYDLLNGVYNRNGITKITLMVDDDTVFRQLKSHLSFSNQRNIVVHMDYDAYKKSGIKYNKLFVDDGNTNDFYTRPSGGYVFSEDSVKTLRIYLEDSYGNISTFESRVNNLKVLNKPDPDISPYELYRNHLHFKADYKKGPEQIWIFLRDRTVNLEPYRTDGKTAYYIWDLRSGLPDSINYSGEVIKPGIYSMIPSEAEVTYFYPDMDISFKKHSLFDTLYLQFEKEVDWSENKEFFRFPHSNFPLRSSVLINLRPELNYPDSNSHVYSIYGDRLSYIGGEWDDGSIRFYTRDLVDFTIAQDSTPPSIQPVIINSNELYFKINDQRSGIRSFRATLNGAFLLMNYEYKKDLIWSRPKDSGIPIQGEFILEVEDNAGNKNTYQRNL